MEATLNVTQNSVYEEVSKTTAYIGAKATTEDEAFKRIALMDEDEVMLSRFWDEGKQGLVELFKPFIKTLSTGDDFSVTLEMSSSWDSTLRGSIERSVKNYLVAIVTGGWCQLTQKSEVESYAEDSAAILRDIKSKLWYRKKPTKKSNS